MSEVELEYCKDCEHYHPDGAYTCHTQAPCSTDRAWGVAKNGNNFYAKYSICGHNAIFLHRLITNCPDNLVVDHINRNTLDNRKSNLRICNNLVNIKNRPINKAGYRGIIQNDVGKYRVRLQINKVKFDKTFDTLERAIRYRNELEEKYHKKEEIICPM